MFLAAAVRVGASLQTSTPLSTPGFSLEGPERVLAFSAKAQGHAVRNPCFGEVHESFANSREDTAAAAFLHTLKGRLAHLQLT